MIKRLSLTLAAMVATFFVVILSVKHGASLLGFKEVSSGATIAFFGLASAAATVFAVMMYEELDKR